MRTCGHHKSGFTWIEILIVIAAVFLLAAVVLPYFARPKIKSKRINCVSNLKQIGLAVRMFADDHGDEFPWRVSASKGGAAEEASTGNPTFQYLAMTNELSSAKILACASDTNVSRASDFANLARANISYFLCLEAEANRHQSLLSGDRNVTGGAYTNGIYYLSTQAGKAGWGKNMHGSIGNTGLSDGSAQMVTAKNFNRQLQMMTNDVARLLVP